MANSHKFFFAIVAGASPPEVFVEYVGLIVYCAVIILIFKRNFSGGRLFDPFFGDHLLVVPLTSIQEQNAQLGEVN